MSANEAHAAGFAVEADATGRRKVEEMANGISHGIGVPFAIAGLALLVASAALRGSTLHITTCAVYGAAIVLLYCASTLYHSVWHPPTKRLLRFFDHACIYLLIAGTYTPFVLVHVRGTWGWTLFAIVWIGAAVGILFKALFTGRFEIVSTISYLVLGWIALIAIEPTLQSIPPGGLKWILGGGIAYTMGVPFYYWDRRIPFGHLIWHLFVLAGTTLHFFAVLYYVIPPSPTA